MKLVYVGGPFRGPNAYEIHSNVMVSTRVALKVWEMGAAALHPNGMSFCLEGTLPSATYLEGDKLMLSKCDAMVTTYDWARSEGTLEEIAHAEKLGIPVFHRLEDLRFWLATQG